MNSFGLYLGLAILLITLLAMNISRLRMQERVANGDGGNKRLKKAIRAHMNALEHIVPYTLLLYFLHSTLETTTLFIVLAFGFLFIRVLHSFSMLGSKFRLRQITAGLTYAFEVLACVLVLIGSHS